MYINDVVVSTIETTTSFATHSLSVTTCNIETDNVLRCSWGEWATTPLLPLGGVLWEKYCITSLRQKRRQIVRKIFIWTCRWTQRDFYTLLPSMDIFFEQFYILTYKAISYQKNQIFNLIIQYGKIASL